MKDIFSVQPEWCRLPLPAKALEIESQDWWIERPELLEKVRRVMFFDPTELYNRIAPHIDPFKRNPGLGMELLFPKLKGLCACGCGKNAKASEQFKEDGVTPTWQRKWHNDVCAAFAADVCSILNNNFQKPSKYITWYYGNHCSECGKDSYDVELDHLHGVKFGGGGAWLSNYKWKCRSCHVDKTNKDFGRKNYRENANLKLDL